MVLKEKSYLTCVQWRIFLPSCTHVTLDFPGQHPQVLSHLLLVVTVFFLAAPMCQLDFPGQIVKSPQVLSHLLLVVNIFPLLHPCAIRFPRSNPHKYPVQVGPEGLGAPPCKYRMVCPRCKFGRTQRSQTQFLLQKRQAKLTPSYRMVPRFCSTRIRSHPFARAGPLQNGRGWGQLSNELSQDP